MPDTITSTHIEPSLKDYESILNDSDIKITSKASGISYRLGIGKRSEALRAFRITKPNYLYISDRKEKNGSVHQDLSRMMQTLSDTDSYHHYKRNKLARNDLYLDARGLSAIIESGNFEMKAKERNRPSATTKSHTEKVQSQIAKLKKKEEKEDLVDEIFKHILKSQSYRKKEASAIKRHSTSPHKDMDQVIEKAIEKNKERIREQIVELTTRHRLLKLEDKESGESFYRLIDPQGKPQGKPSTIDSIPGQKQAFFDFLINEDCDHFLSRKISSNVPGRKHLAGREIYHFTETQNGGSSSTIVIDGFDDLVIGLVTIKRVEDLGGSNAGNGATNADGLNGQAIGTDPVDGTSGSPTNPGNGATNGDGLNGQTNQPSGTNPVDGASGSPNLSTNSPEMGRHGDENTLSTDGSAATADNNDEDALGTDESVAATNQSSGADSSEATDGTTIEPDVTQAGTAEASTSYTPNPNDRGMFAGQAFGLYPVFMVLVWLGVAGLRDEKNEKRKEFNRILAKVGGAKNKLSEIKKSIEGGKVTEEDIQFVKGYVSENDALKTELQKKLFLKIKELEQQQEVEASIEERKEAWKELQFARVGFGAMSLMFGAVTLYECQALGNLIKPASGVTHGTQEPVFSMETTGYENLSDIFSANGGMATTASMFATIGQVSMSIYAGYEFYETRSEHAAINEKIRTLEKSKTLNDDSRSFSVQMLKKERKYKRWQLFSKLSLSSGQMAMATCGPLMASFPPGLCAGIGLTLSAVGVDMVSSHQEDKKLGYDEDKKGALQKKIADHFQREMQNKLTQLQQETIKARKDNATYKILKAEIEGGREDMVGTFDLIYFKIASTYVLEEGQSMTKKDRERLTDDINSTLPNESKIDKQMVDRILKEAKTIEENVAKASKFKEVQIYLYKTIKDRNQAMTDASKLQALPLILNQLTKRIARTCHVRGRNKSLGSRALSKNSIELAIKNLKYHYDSNQHQPQLATILDQCQEEIAQLLETGFSSSMHKKPKDNWNQFLPSWLMVTKEMQKAISNTPSKEITDNAHGITTLMKAKIKAAEGKVTATIGKSPATMKSMIEDALADKDLKYKTMKEITGKEYGYRFMKQVTGNRDPLIAGKVKRNGKEKEVYRYSKEDILDNAGQDDKKGKRITEAMLALCRDELKKDYRSEYFNCALDVVSEQGVSYLEDSGKKPSPLSEHLAAEPSGIESSVTGGVTDTNSTTSRSISRPIVPQPQPPAGGGSPYPRARAQHSANRGSPYYLGSRATASDIEAPSSTTGLQRPIAEAPAPPNLIARYQRQHPTTTTTIVPAVGSQPTAARATASATEAPPPTAGHQRQHPTAADARMSDINAKEPIAEFSKAIDEQMFEALDGIDNVAMQASKLFTKNIKAQKELSKTQYRELARSSPLYARLHEKIKANQPSEALQIINVRNLAATLTAASKYFNEIKSDEDYISLANKSSIENIYETLTGKTIEGKKTGLGDKERSYLQSKAKQQSVKEDLSKELGISEESLQDALANAAKKIRQEEDISKLSVTSVKKIMNEQEVSTER